MTTDERIAQDLAVVGRVSLQQPIALETTLRRIHAVRDPSTRSSPADLVHVVLRCSRIYAQRVSRAWSGVALLAAITALIALVAFPHSSALWEQARPTGSTAEIVLDVVIRTFGELLLVSKVWVAAMVLLVALAARHLGARVAARRFERVIGIAEDPATVSRQHVRRLDRWPLAVAMSGTMAFILFFGTMLVSIGEHGLYHIFQTYSDEYVRQLNAWTLGMLLAAIVASCLGAALLARTRRANTRLLIGIGALLGLATVILGLRFDVGPLFVTVLAHERPSLVLRGLLTASGTIGLLLVVAGFMLRRRDREQAELATSAGG